MKISFRTTRALFMFISVLVISGGTFAQPGWNIITPSPTNQTINAVSFINANTGWMACSGDLILKTTDGGTTWTKQSAKPGQDWWGLCFTDAQHGWVVNTWGGISATADGGNTWSQQAVASSKYFYAIQFPDATHGFVLLEQDSLFYTTNGGTTWNRIKIDASQYHYGMSFVNAGEGWICGGGGQILHSANGGVAWTSQVSGTTLDLNTIFFTDSQHGWAAGYSNSDHGLVLHTSNGGATWGILVQNFNDDFTKIIFTDNQNGCAISSSGIIYRTTDGGTTWTAKYTSPHEGILDIQVRSSGTGIACGTNGAILKTVNSGDAWSPLYHTATHGYHIRDLSFPDQHNGWVLDDAAYLMHTSDDGVSWNDQTPYPASFTAAAIYFSDPLRGWVVGKWPAGGFGQILRTTDGGVHFQFQLNTGIYPFVSVSFADSLHGIAGTNNRKIYHTSNGGVTWDSSSVATSAVYMQAKKVQMVNAATGYAILSSTGNTALARTTNGGQSWTVVKTDNTQFTAAFTALSFVDPQNGYLAAFNFNSAPNKFSLLKTTDGGTTWTPLTFPSNLPGNIGSTQINSLHFSDMQHGWAAGGGTESFILHTDDGGTTWNMQETGTTVSWYTMQFLDAQVAWAAGWDGNIVKTTNGGSLGVNEITGALENRLLIYPNPAGESVVVSFPVSGNTKAELQVSDMHGREIFSCRFASPSYRLDIANYPPGTYLVRVITGRQTFTKKLVVSR